MADMDQEEAALRKEMRECGRRCGNLRRAIDYLENRCGPMTAQMNRVVAILEHWMVLYDRHEELHKFFKNNSLPQEICESLCILEILTNMIENTDEPLVFIDMCCGQGFLSCLLSHYFTTPMLQHKIIATDIRMGRQTKRNAAVDKEQFEFLAPHATMTLTYAQNDIHSKQFKQFIEAQEGQVVLLGIHLCKKLSARAVDLHSKTGARTLILAPCCIPSMKKRSTFFCSGGVGVCHVCMREAEDKYEFWDRALMYQIEAPHKYLFENKILQARKQHARHRYLIGSLEPLDLPVWTDTEPPCEHIDPWRDNLCPPAS